MQQLDLFAAFEDEKRPNAVTGNQIPGVLPFAKDEKVLTPHRVQPEENIAAITETTDEVIEPGKTSPEPEPVAKEVIIAPVEIPEENIQPAAIEEKGKVVKVKEPKATTNKRGRMSFKEMDADLVMVEVPEDAVLFQKQYYGMREVAKWFHVNQSLLRYWENEFDILKPRKTRKGDRLFRPEDVKNLQLIYFLLRQRKFSIEGTKQYLKENKQKADVHMQLMQSLTKFRAFLLEWKAILSA